MTGFEVALAGLRRLAKAASFVIVVRGALIALTVVSRRFPCRLIELLELGQNSGGQLDIVMPDQAEASPQLLVDGIHGCQVTLL